MAKIEYNNTDNEALSSAIEHFYIGEPPKSDVKRGRPRKCANDEERKQHIKDSNYNLNYYYKKLIVPYKCTICGGVCNSATALRIHTNSSNKCKLIKETMQFLSSEQHEKLKEMIHKDKVK